MTEEKLAILRKADAIYLDEIRKRGLYDKIWQAFAVLLPVRTVGVMGDARTYDFVCALRAVTSTDGMTADYYDFSPRFSRARWRGASSTRCAASTAWSTTSPPSRPAPSSGSSQARSLLVKPDQMPAMQRLAAKPDNQAEMH